MVRPNDESMEIDKGEVSLKDNYTHNFFKVSSVWDKINPNVIFKYKDADIPSIINDIVTCLRNHKTREDSLG